MNMGCGGSVKEADSDQLVVNKEFSLTGGNSELSLSGGSVHEHGVAGSGVDFEVGGCQVTALESVDCLIANKRTQLTAV